MLDIKYVHRIVFNFVYYFMYFKLSIIIIKEVYAYKSSISLNNYNI
jgi:hypothetical protein